MSITESAAGSTSVPARKLKIAAVDDEDAIRKLIAVTLQGLYDVTTYPDPDSALEAFRGGEHPDLILSDVMMPRMSGFELHAAVREVPALRSVPFLFLTAMSDRGHVRRGMVQGADDYITKPFELQELRDAVRARLERAVALRQSETAGLVISSLGGVGVQANGERLQWEARKVVVLLLYLLAHGYRAPLRDVRADLWEERVQENSVRVLINRLRKALDGVGEARVKDEVLELVLPGPVSWDATTFSDAAGNALEGTDAMAVENAIALYRGTFLPGFDSPWAEAERARLEDLYVALLEAAVELSEGPAVRTAEARLESFLDTTV